MSKGSKDTIIEPTAEQRRRGEFEQVDVNEKGRGGVLVKMGKAFRRRPMIDVLAEQGLFSDAEYKALKHYRHHADIADRSPLRDSIATLMRLRGSGNPPSVELLNAIRVRDDCERAAGVLRDILRAVVVDDASLSDWAMRTGGAIEKCREKKGKRDCRLEARPKALSIARLDIQMAAKRVQAELDA